MKKISKISKKELRNMVVKILAVLIVAFMVLSGFIVMFSNL